MKSKNYYLFFLAFTFLFFACDKTDKNQNEKNQVDKKSELEAKQKTDAEEKKKQRELEIEKKKKEENEKNENEFYGTYVKKEGDDVIAKFVANKEHTYSFYFNGEGAICDEKEIGKVYNIKGKWVYYAERAGEMHNFYFLYNNKEYRCESYLFGDILKVYFLGCMLECKRVK